MGLRENILDGISCMESINAKKADWADLTIPNDYVNIVNQVLEGDLLAPWIFSLWEEKKSKLSREEWIPDNYFEQLRRYAV